MKNLNPTSKFQLRKTIVTRFGQPTTAQAPISSSIIDTRTTTMF